MSCNWCTNRSFMVLMSLVKSPIARILFVSGTHSAAGSSPARCDARLLIPANQLIARLFLAAAKPRGGTSEHRERWNGRMADTKRRQDSNLVRNGICRACDNRADQRLKLALSRTAQRDVFALWVF